MDKAIMLIDSAIDTLCEVGNGVTEKDLHEAATALFEARELLYKILDENKQKA